MNIAPGTVVRFNRGDGSVEQDTVREVFWQETTSEQGVAFVLTNHSWCWASDVVDARDQLQPMTLERAADLARRGFQPIDLDVWAPTGPDGTLQLVRRKSPREVLAELTAVLGEYPVGGEEGLHVFPTLTMDCANCPPSPYRSSGRSCSKYDDHFDAADGERGGCRIHTTCQKFTPLADAPWPDGRLTVFSVRGSSEGDYTHVEVRDGDGRSELILLAKTFQGRDASWTFARHVADLLGV